MTKICGYWMMVSPILILEPKKIDTDSWARASLPVKPLAPYYKRTVETEHEIVNKE